jgi:hypothetical protein
MTFARCKWSELISRRSLSRSTSNKPGSAVGINQESAEQTLRSKANGLYLCKDIDYRGLITV